jgi:hypothetical protein
MTLREIAAGEVTFENIDDLPEAGESDELAVPGDPEQGEEA